MVNLSWAEKTAQKDLEEKSRFNKYFLKREKIFKKQVSVTILLAMKNQIRFVLERASFLLIKILKCELS